MDERKTTAASALALQLGGADLPLRQDHPGRGGSHSSVFSVACQERTPRSSGATHSQEGVFKKATAQAPSSGGTQFLQGWMAKKTGLSQRVQHRLAERRSTTLLPFPLSPKSPSRNLVVHAAREKQVSLELFHDAARRLESDTTRLSSPRGTVCGALKNAVAQQGLQLFPRTSIECALAFADSAAIRFARGHNTISAEASPCPNHPRVAIVDLSGKDRPTKDLIFLAREL